MVHVVHQFGAQLGGGGDHHLLQGLGLVEVGHVVAVIGPGVHFVGGLVLFDGHVAGVHQIHRHEGGHVPNALHIAVHQQHTGDAGDVVVGGGDVVVDEGGAAVDTDDVAVGQAAVVVVVSRRAAGHVAVDVGHGHLQLEEGVLIGLGEAAGDAAGAFGNGGGGGDKHHAAHGLLDDLIQAQIHQIRLGVFLGFKVGVGVHQDGGVHAGTGAGRGIDAGGTHDVGGSLRIAVQGGVGHVGLAHGPGQVFHFIDPGFFQGLEGGFVVEALLIVEGQGVHHAQGHHQAQHQAYQFLHVCSLPFFDVKRPGRRRAGIWERNEPFPFPRPESLRAVSMKAAFPRKRAFFTGYQFNAVFFL